MYGLGFRVSGSRLRAPCHLARILECLIFVFVKYAMHAHIYIYIYTHTCHDSQRFPRISCHARRHTCIPTFTQMPAHNVYAFAFPLYALLLQYKWHSTSATCKENARIL